MNPTGWGVWTMSLGAFVEQRRRRLGLTQEEVVARMGMGHPATWISRLERDPNRRLPAPEEIRALAQALETTEAELIRAYGYMQDAEHQVSASASGVGVDDEWILTGRELSSIQRRAIIALVRTFVDLGD